MSKDDDDKKDDDKAKGYKVGYKKPPKKTQFKKGKSGNPKGRPKKKERVLEFGGMTPEALRQTVLAVSAQPIEVRENGEAITMSRMEAVYTKLHQKALSGSVYAIRLCHDILEKSADMESERRANLIDLLAEGEQFEDERYKSMSEAQWQEKVNREKFTPSSPDLSEQEVSDEFTEYCRDRLSRKTKKENG